MIFFKPSLLDQFEHFGSGAGRIAGFSGLSNDSFNFFADNEVERVPVVLAGSVAPSPLGLVDSVPEGSKSTGSYDPPRSF